MDETKKNVFPLPQNTVLLSHQIAGHMHGKGKTGLGMLKHDDGSVLKPLLEDVRGQREFQFYETVFNESCVDPDILALRTFLPHYNGIWHGELSGMRVKYLRMNDVTEAFQKASILDIKIGRQTYDPEAKPEKIKYEKLKYPAVETIGFRILGMRVFDPSTQEFLFLGNDFGKKQTSHTLTNALHLYLNRSSDRVSQAIVSSFLHKLHDIEKWFRKQRKFAFYASSLLFIYESDKSLRDKLSKDINEKRHLPECSLASVNFTCDNTCDSSGKCFIKEVCHCGNATCDHIKQIDSLHCSGSEICSECYLDQNLCSQISRYRNFLCSIHMVDFAHVFTTNQQDENYLFGLSNLINFFQSLQKYLQML